MGGETDGHKAVMEAGPHNARAAGFLSLGQLVEICFSIPKNWPNQLQMRQLGMKNACQWNHSVDTN